MKTYDELKALIIQRGVHAEFGDAGEGWGIEQNPDELATFLVRMQEIGVTSCLEIGTGYKAGLSRFLAQDMGWDVTSVDINNYHHVYPGVHYVVLGMDEQSNPIRMYVRAKSFDLVFIDGKHSLLDVSHDYHHHELAAIKAIAFHDVAGLRDCAGAKRFWLELVEKSDPFYIHQVYADDKPAGIGWVEK